MLDAVARQRIFLITEHSIRMPVDPHTSSNLKFYAKFLKKMFISNIFFHPNFGNSTYFEKYICNILLKLLYFK